MNKLDYFVQGQGHNESKKMSVNVQMISPIPPNMLLQNLVW